MVKRELYLERLRSLKDINLIKAVTGIRRSGKSTLLQQFREELANENAGNIIAYNLEEKENELFINNPDSLYREIMSRVNLKKRNYIFIDEVQMVPEFERMLDSLFVKPYTDIYVTGSNAYMLSSDIATLLTGRYLEVKMQPLGFSEYRDFFPEIQDTHSLFRQFMRYGGFPEVANMLNRGATAEIPVYLQNLYSTILEKDIKKRKQIRAMDDFQRILLYCFGNIGNPTSPGNIANVLKSEHHNIDHKTVDEYLQAMVDCFLLYRVGRYDVRGKNLLRTLEKYYAVDLGLADTLLNYGVNADTGHRLENIIYLELERRYHNVCVGKNYDKEIDFVVKNSSGELEYFQVAQTVAEAETLSRELAAIRNTGDYYRRTILTLDLIDRNVDGIRCRNVIDWLLEAETAPIA